MAVDIKLKRSAVPGKVPNTSSLELGELALNTYDGKAYFKKQIGATESIVELASTSGSILSASYATYAANAGSASYSNFAATALSASFANQSANAVSASYALSASFANNATSASYALSASYGLSSSYALSASYSNTATSASYANNSSYTEFASTASSADNFLVRGTLTAQTIIAQTITSSTEFITGSTKFGTLLTDTHQFTGSVSITGSLGINGVDYNSTSASFDTRITNNSASIASLSASFTSFSGSYNTGSFTGSFNGNFTGSFSGSLNNLQGTPTHIPFFSSSQILANSAMFQVDDGSGVYSIAINENGVDSSNPEALFVSQTSTSSFNVITGKGNLNNYLQLNIKNSNQGTNASSDVVATANNGNESTYYVNMGINSQNYSGFLGGPNDAYVYATGSEFHIGNTTPNKHLGFFVGGGDVDTGN
jgi:hypothetical protein